MSLFSDLDGLVVDVADEAKQPRPMLEGGGIEDSGDFRLERSGRERMSASGGTRAISVRPCRSWARRGVGDLEVHGQLAGQPGAGVPGLPFFF